MKILSIPLNRFVIAFVVVFSYACSMDPTPGPNPGNYELYVKERDQDPAFSPDGQFIAYYHNSNSLQEPLDYPSGLYIINKDGSNRKLVLAGHHYHPSWSPDGNWLVFSSQGVIQKCTSEGENLTTFDGLNGMNSSFEDALFYPDWTPDGERILFDKHLGANWGIYSMTFDFNDVQKLFELESYGVDPELSPNGEYVVYDRGGPDVMHSEIFIRSFDNGIERRLTVNNRDNRDATWSPDGEKIAWNSNSKIYTMNADGSNHKKITYGRYPTWSIDNTIVFSFANKDYSREVLWAMNVEGSDKWQLTF